MNRAAFFIILYCFAGQSAPETDWLPMTENEKHVYLEILRCAENGLVGLPFPDGLDVFVHQVSIVRSVDTLTSYRQSPREFDSALESFRHGYRGAIAMGDLASDGLKIVNVLEFVAQRRLGVKVFLYHIGFNEDKSRAVSIVWIDWTRKDGYYYHLKALVFLTKTVNEWSVKDYKPLDIERGWID